jgi:hypothetical protein
MTTKLSINVNGYEFHRYPASEEKEEGYQPVKLPNSIVIEGDGKPLDIPEGQAGYLALSELFEAFIRLNQFVDNIENNRSEATSGILVAQVEDDEG